jgi:hypothetical protein
MGTADRCSAAARRSCEPDAFILKMQRHTDPSLWTFFTGHRLANPT